MQDFDEIYRLYSQPVYRFVLKLCGNTEIAEEIMQETFYKAVRYSDRFNGRWKGVTWLCTIARNEYINFTKKKENSNISTDDFSYYGDSFNIEDMFEDREQALGIHKAMHALDEPYKEIFSLRVMGELSFRDIGGLFERSENWARVNFFRAKQKIIELLKEDGYEL